MSATSSDATGVANRSADTTTESEAGNPAADIELPDPEDFSSSGDFKKAVYDQIEDGVPSLMMDLKLEITWRKANDVELEDYMKEVLKDE